MWPSSIGCLTDLMMILLLLTACVVCVSAEDGASADAAFLRLKNITAAQTFIQSAEVTIVGFFLTDSARGYKEFLSAVEQIQDVPVALCSETEVWTEYNITTDTVTIFRKADLEQKHLQVSKAKKIETDGLVRFMMMNNIRYITEYNQVSAVGLFQSQVKVHVLLLIDRGRADSDQLQERMRTLATQYVGKMLFVLVNGKERSNARVLDYFGLKSHDLPRVGIYDVDADRKWVLPAGEVTTERVQDFCDSYLRGDLQETKVPEEKSEL